MKNSIVVALLVLFFSASMQAQELDRDIHYAAGLASFQRGAYADAAEALVKAMNCDPVPQSAGDGYLPYAFLAAAYFEMGEFARARAALVQSQMFGVAAKTRKGVALLDRYAPRIMAVDVSPQELAEVGLPAFSPAARPGLTDAEVAEIRTQVLRNCAISSRVKDSKLPWYFHYEFGTRLLEAGDSARALEALLTGADKRVESGRDNRMYGMWYVDYLPYYQMALAHSKLGQWESAYDAIRTSHNFGEFTPSDPDWESFVTLQRLIESKVHPGDS